MGLHQLASVNMQRNGHPAKSAILLLRKHSAAKHPIMHSPLEDEGIYRPDQSEM